MCFSEMFVTKNHFTAFAWPVSKRQVQFLKVRQARAYPLNYRPLRMPQKENV
jgi:hypothetical protein